MAVMLGLVSWRFGRAAGEVQELVEVEQVKYWAFEVTPMNSLALLL
jgi:hypothetical protein